MYVFSLRFFQWNFATNYTNWRFKKWMWMDYTSEKEYRYKIRRTWKPSSIHNRSIERKFAEIFDLILDRLLMYYEWNILHELKLDSISLKCGNFFFVKRSKKFMIIWNGADKIRAILDSQWIYVQSRLCVFTFCKENLYSFVLCFDKIKKM